MMKTDNREVNIGFDTGISSAGWSVVDTKTGEIIETGVRLFSGADAARNLERRTNRQSRRLTRRSAVRMKDARKLFKKQFQLNKDIEIDSSINPYEVRVKGLDEELTDQELIQALLNIIKHRGINYDLGDLEDEDGSSGNQFKDSINRNRQELKTKTPGQIQLERLQKYGELRGQFTIEENEESFILRNIFSNEAYVNEAKLILKKQQEFNSKITDQFIEDVVSIITRKRQYFEGPGSEKSRTDYGIYRTNGETLDNLFEILIGKDKFYPNEYRAAASSYTAQLYNLLNDLNNLRITSTEDQHLTEEHKKTVIEELKHTSRLSGGMLKLISKVTGTPKDEIRGYRTNEKDKPEIHSLAVYRKARNKFIEYDIDINDWPIEFIDAIAPIMTLNTEPGEIRKQLNQLVQEYPLLNERVNDGLLLDILVENYRLFIGESNNKWHRFSIKLMKELIPELLATTDEQSTILTNRGLIQQEKGIVKENGDIDINQVLEDIYNPVVVKSVREMLKVFNALTKKYTNINTVVIEMPRETNADDAKRKRDAAMKKNKQNKDKAIQLFMESAHITEAQYEYAVRQNRKLPTKIRLWWEQNQVCPYSGNHIEASQLLNYPDNYEIDHIIPQSISFDDRLSNKVLCEARMNQEKGQQTPYGFMRENANGHQSFKEMKAMIKGWKNLSKNKVANLIFDEDIEDIETRKRFIQRNLVDTRYASRIILSALQNYAKAKDNQMKVTVIRGQFTDMMRRKMSLEKTRETHHHHAVDASIIAMSPQLKLWAMKKDSPLTSVKATSEIVDVETGEIVAEKEFNEQLMLPDHLLTFISEANQLIPQNRIKFSHQVDKKMNRKVSDATIYSTRQAQLAKDKEEVTYVISKIKDIYDTKEYEKFKKLYDKDKSKFIMAQKDPQTFAKLEKIMNEYSDFIEEEINGKVKKVSVSPFELYRRENGYVTKYSKKNNGPKVVQMKYYDTKIGNHIDITPSNTSNKKVILQSLKPWRTDVYFNQQTQEYGLLGIKYSDLKYKNGAYGILEEHYQELKKAEKISEEAEFLFSLYRNDCIKVVNDSGESVELLFGSRTMNVKNYVELKPIEKYKFDPKEYVELYGVVSKVGQFIKPIVKKGWKLYKVNIDILGNAYYSEKEAETPKNIIAND